jgi:hypothetical protein
MDIYQIIQMLDLLVEEEIILLNNSENEFIILVLLLIRIIIMIKMLTINHQIKFLHLKTHLQTLLNYLLIWMMIKIFIHKKEKLQLLQVRQILRDKTFQLYKQWNLINNLQLFNKVIINKIKHLKWIKKIKIFQIKQKILKINNLMNPK